MVKFQSETGKPEFLQDSGQAKAGSNSWEFSWEDLLNKAAKHDIQYWLYMEWFMISQAALLMPQSNPKEPNLRSHLTYLYSSPMCSQKHLSPSRIQHTSRVSSSFPH